MKRSSSWLTVAATAALVASLMPLLARASWVFDLTSHFRLQYVVVDVLLAILLVTRRRYAWAAGLAACAVLSAVPVLPYLPSALAETAAATPERPRVRVLVANVFYRNSSARRLVETIRREAPDLVLLVEYTTELAGQLGELRETYRYQLQYPRRDAYGIALFSRLELKSAQTVQLGPTAAIDARVRVGNSDVTLLGVHLRSPMSWTRAAERNRQLESLAERVSTARDSVIIAGDFNISPYSPYYTDWLRRTALTDVRRGRTPRPSWPTFLPIVAIPIDHCFVSPDITVIGERGSSSFGSDHYPLIVELALPPTDAEYN
jgi:endonuclease/exonuclease/phosphatase (EEP) superfamily protein YafD